MGKISPVTAKYIIHSKINIDGVVDRPDVIGAIFGQTEGLLGEELELRELQRSGKIGRIEVNTDTRSGKTGGVIIIPSSLDKAETSIVAAALEIIQRIGPCNAKIEVEKIEDVRVSRRTQVIERAKQLLRQMMENVLPDSQELAEEVINSVRTMEVIDYGKDRLPAGPGIDEGDEIIVVEGRADVVNLLKYGFKNAIAINGTSIPQTIIDLCSKKTVTAFVDGDRGGNLILKELLAVAEIDFVTQAPHGKEVEEITQKEIHKALRSRITAEQAKLDLTNVDTSERIPGVRQQIRTQQREPVRETRSYQSYPQPRTEYKPAVSQKKVATPDEKKKFKSELEDLVGTRGAHILDNKLNLLGKVPVTELQTTLNSLTSGVYAVVLDGSIDKELAYSASRGNVSFLVGMDTQVQPTETKVTILTAAEL
ncbi:MAG: DNA primase DnaG [Candidatus Woesearchaeota archaeon]